MKTLSAPVKLQKSQCKRQELQQKTSVATEDMKTQKTTKKMKTKNR